MKFEKQELKTRLIELLNNTRVFLTGISFGDQAQFFRAEALEHIGGFPAVMLMEDVELSLRLKELSRILFFTNGVLVSGRRWRQGKFFRNFLTVLWLCTRYLIERRLRKSDVPYHEYYDAYYGRR